MSHCIKECFIRKLSKNRSTFLKLIGCSATGHCSTFFNVTSRTRTAIQHHYPDTERPLSGQAALCCVFSGEGSQKKLSFLSSPQYGTIVDRSRGWQLRIFYLRRAVDKTTGQSGISFVVCLCSSSSHNGIGLAGTNPFCCNSPLFTPSRFSEMFYGISPLFIQPNIRKR